MTKPMRGTSIAAIAAVAALGLGACSMPAGSMGNVPTQGGAAGTTDRASGNGGATSLSAGDASGASGTGGASSLGGAPSSMEISPFGHWKCVSVWANGSKIDAAESGEGGDYYDFYDDGSVFSYVSGMPQIADYSFSGATGTITYPGAISTDYDEVFEISPTSDGTGLAMKVNFKGIAPENFRVYKLTGDARDLQTNPDAKDAIERYRMRSDSPSSAQPVPGASLGSGGASSGSGSGSSGSAGSSGSPNATGAGSGYDDSDSPAPGTVIDGWEWV